MVNSFSSWAMFWAVSTASTPTTIFQPETSGVIGWVRWRGVSGRGSVAACGPGAEGARPSSGEVSAGLVGELLTAPPSARCRGR